MDTDNLNIGFTLNCFVMLHRKQNNRVNDGLGMKNKLPE